MKRLVIANCNLVRGSYIIQGVAIACAFLGAVDNLTMVAVAYIGALIGLWAYTSTPVVAADMKFDAERGGLMMRVDKPVKRIEKPKNKQPPYDDDFDLKL